jgi:FkbM family methyltransferase
MKKTYSTAYGKLTLYRNEMFIGTAFMRGKYWDEKNLILLKKYIDPSRNILEIGGHCGTSSIVYASYLKDSQKVFVYEPQKKMYELLLENIAQNNLEDKIIPFNQAVFCSEETEMRMSSVDLDGCRGAEVRARLEHESFLPCNFGGLPLGGDGERVSATTIDTMPAEVRDNIGFIHCDAQGSENFIFSAAKKTIAKCLPVIYYEDNEALNHPVFRNVVSSYPEYAANSRFSIDDYCVKELGYTKIKNFNGEVETLLIPPPNPLF